MSVRKAIYAGLLLLLPLILILSGGFLTDDKAMDGSSSDFPDPVKVLEEKNQDETDRDEGPVLYLSGEVHPADEVDIFPDTRGKVSEVRIEAGDLVEKNQILAMIDASRPGMNYTLSPVRSTISGTVTAVYSDPGAFIEVSRPVCRIGTLSRLEIDSYVPEAYIEKVYRGMKAQVSSPVIPSLKETLVLSRISPVLDPRTRSMKVVFVPENSENRLKSGMFVDLVLQLE